MRERRMLRLPLSLAALAVCGVMLSGCGDDGNNSSFNLSDPDINQLPSCGVVAAFVDLATQQIVVQVTIHDPDQLSQQIGMEVELELITGTGVFGNDIDSASTGNVLIGNTAFGVAYSNIAPGAQTEFRISSTNPQLLPSDPNSSVRVTVRDELGGTSQCTAPVDLSLLLSEPDCQILNPGANDVGTGLIPIDLQVSDNQGDNAQLSAYWSLDGGATWNGATLTATTAGTLNGAPNTCNPGNPYSGDTVTGIATALGGAPTALTITWDSAADGVGANALANVTLGIITEDCTTVPIGGVFNAPCTADTQVINNGAPVCAIQRPQMGDSIGGTGTVTVAYSVTDGDSALVESTFYWSTDNGATWSLATAAGGSTNPTSAAPGNGTYGWDAPADIAVGSLPANVVFRVVADDLTGRPTLPDRKSVV